jgi:hypothetical protein
MDRIDISINIKRITYNKKDDTQNACQAYKGRGDIILTGCRNYKEKFGNFDFKFSSFTLEYL